MGKRARQHRAQVKDLCRRLNYKEDEFGELRYKMTKAEARRRFVGREQRKRAAIQSLIDICTKRAYDDICSIEDAEFIQHVNQLMENRV